MTCKGRQAGRRLISEDGVGGYHPCPGRLWEQAQPSAAVAAFDGLVRRKEENTGPKRRGKKTSFKLKKNNGGKEIEVKMSVCPKKPSPKVLPNSRMNQPSEGTTRKKRGRSQNEQLWGKGLLPGRTRTHPPKEQDCATGTGGWGNRAPIVEELYWRPLENIQKGQRKLKERPSKAVGGCQGGKKKRIKNRPKGKSKKNRLSGIGWKDRDFLKSKRQPDEKLKGFCQRR